MRKFKSILIVTIIAMFVTLFIASWITTPKQQAESLSVVPTRTLTAHELELVPVGATMGAEMATNAANYPGPKVFGQDQINNQAFGYVVLIILGFGVLYFIGHLLGAGIGKIFGG